MVVSGSISGGLARDLRLRVSRCYCQACWISLGAYGRRWCWSLYPYHSDARIANPRGFFFRLSRVWQCGEVVTWPFEKWALEDNPRGSVRNRWGERVVFFDGEDLMVGHGILSQFDLQWWFYLDEVVSRSQSCVFFKGYDIDCKAIVKQKTED